MSDVIRIDGRGSGRPVRAVPADRLVGPGAAGPGAGRGDRRGALGNEIVKDLALLGRQERLRRRSRPDRKLEPVAVDPVPRSATAAGPRPLWPPSERPRFTRTIQVQPFVGNIVYDLGQGIYRWADVILGGLDNREARVAINLAAARAGKVWIDGAIERLDGVARVFDPATGPCYECTMGENDWKMLEARRSCALLSRDEMELGKVPTTPTTASIIAGIQVQEAIKYLHGLETIAGQGFVFDGTHHQSYLVSYTRKADCPAHDADLPVETLPWQVSTTRAGDLLERVRSDLGPDAVIETGRDLLASLHCSKCGEDEPVFASLGKVTEAQGRCPACREPRTPAAVPHDRRPPRRPAGLDAGRDRRPSLGRSGRPRRHGSAVLRARRRPRPRARAAGRR